MRAAWESRKTKAFPMPADDDGSEACVGGESGEESRVAFAHCKAGIEGGDGRRRLYAVVEESFGIIVDVVVEPGKDRAGLVSGRGKRGGELRGQPVYGRHCVAGKGGGVGIGGREVAAFEAGVR